MINPEIRRKHKLKKPFLKSAYYRMDEVSPIKDFKHGPCLICGRMDASKTNSHLVPSFLVSMYDSYDNSGKRGRDLQFSITDTGRSIYVGAIPSTKYEEIFDKDSLEDDTRIEELKKNPDAQDFVFCTSCEKLLAEYLEEPYADSLKQNKHIDGFVAYYFWASVIWRMDSCRRYFGFHLDETISRAMHDMLLSYFVNAGKITDQNKPNLDVFKYKVLCCRDFCKKTQSGFQHCNYNDGVLTFIISDFIFIGYFGGKEKLPDSYMFACLRNSIANAEMNVGTGDDEKKLFITHHDMDETIRTFILYAVKIKNNHYERILQALWEQLNIPIPLSEPIVKDVISEIFSEETKLAERESIDSIAIAINNVLNKYGVTRL